MTDEQRLIVALVEALYGEVRRPINANGGCGHWEDGHIASYLLHRWGIRIPPEVEAARLARVGKTWGELAKGEGV